MMSVLSSSEGRYLLKETGQKLKSHYGVIPIMIVLFINRTYLKYLNAGLSH